MSLLYSLHKFSFVSLYVSQPSSIPWDERDDMSWDERQEALKRIEEEEEEEEERACREAQQKSQQEGSETKGRFISTIASNQLIQCTLDNSYDCIRYNS